MKVMVDSCVVLMGVGVSVSEQIALCEKIITEGFVIQLHPMAPSFKETGRNSRQ